MNRPSVIYLLKTEYETNAYGVMVPTDTARMVYADVESVTGSEWFEGGRNGLNPEFRMRIHAIEYKGEESLIYDGKTFSIYRTYRDSDIIELYVEKKKGDEHGND